MRLLWPNNFASIACVISRGPLQHHAANRLIAMSAPRAVRKIKITQGETITRIEGEEIASPRVGRVVSGLAEAPHDSCPLCRLNLKRLSYSDVLILNQFVDVDGRMLAKEETGLCSRQYYHVTKCVHDAQRCRLMKRPPDFPSYGPWDMLNAYHEWPRTYRDQPLKKIQPDYWNISPVPPVINPDFKNPDEFK